MNIVYDVNSGRVISLFSNEIHGDEREFLKTTFPDKYNSLSIWDLKTSTLNSPLFLRVKVDNNKIPECLLFKNKIIYKCTKEERNKNEEKILKKRNVELGKKISRNLLRSMGADIIRTWSSSVYTQPDIAKSLKTLEYFWEKEIIPVSWWGPFTDAGGYANMNREILFRLHNYHIIAKADICPTAPQIMPQTQYYVSKYSSFDLSRFKGHIKIWAFTPLPHPPNPKKNIFFTMMETESLHPEFSRLCNAHADEIWVPSTHNKRVFEEYGVNKPIYVMPLGVDENLYSIQQDHNLGVINGNLPFVDLLGPSFTKGIRSFRFISLFGWSYRKGIDILIKSFVEQFNDKDDVCLIVLARHAGSPAPEHVNIIKNDTIKYASMVRNSRYPQIILYPHVIPEISMPSMFKMGHVFISASRGEGYSLPPIEAAACGLPVISCNNTGMSEYLTDENSYMITTNEKEICSPEMHWITAYYQGQLFPKLGRNQIEQAKKHMSYVINNYPAAIEKGKNLTKLVFEKYTWNHAARRVAERIIKINGDNF